MCGLQVETNKLSYAMELISKVHMQLLQRRASVQLDDGSTIPYPASDSVVLLEGDQDFLTFHLLHKDLDTTHMTPLMVMGEYTSIIAWTMGRPSGQTACLQLTTACKFSHELQMMMCEGAKGALQAHACVCAHSNSFGML